MATLGELRRQAKEMKVIPTSEIRSAKTPAALQAVIDSYGEDGESTRPRKKSAVKKAVAKKAQAQAQRRTRSKSASSTSAPAKSPRGRQAKRPTTASHSGNGNGGRITLVDEKGRSIVDYSVTDGWPAREGSPPDRIVKLLKRFRGNRTRVYEELAPLVDEFVTPKKRDGTRRSKDEKLAMLKYRISRTAWEFAVRTGQHTASENRVKYGTGGTGMGIWKPASARKKAAARKPAARKASTARKSASRQKPAPRQARKPAARKPAARQKPKPRARARQR